MTRPHAGLPAAVLWDMDGTLVDTEPYWFASERDLVEEYGGRWPDEMAEQIVGFDLLDGAAFIRDHSPVDLTPPEIVDRLLDGVVARLHRSIPWRPGARELLAELNALGVPCALVTMSWRRFADPVLAALPAGSFAASITGEEVPDGRGKPHPDPYLMGAEAVGADPADCVAIEDSPTGARSAASAGCRVIGVPNAASLDGVDGITRVETLAALRAADLVAVTGSPVTSTAQRARGWNARGAAVLVALAAIAAVLVGVAVARSDEPEAVLPPGAVPIDVWAPYWTLDDAVPEAADRLGDVRQFSPFWYAARGADIVVVNERVPTELADTMLDLVDDTSANVVPSVLDEMEPGGMAALLADPEQRALHIDTLVELADELDADGLDLDYEQFAFADGRSTWSDTRPHWVDFVAGLAERLHDDGRILVVSIPPVYDGERTADSGFWVYDHGAIAEHVDQIRIMAYQYSGNQPGPVAPLEWVRRSIDGVSGVVAVEHHHKLVLGVPTYGTNAVVSTEGTCPDSAEGTTNVTPRNVADLADRRSGVPRYDEVLGEWTFDYELVVDDGTTRCTQFRSVHWVDTEGAVARIELARRADWGAVAIWALGYEDPELWDAVVSASHRALMPVPDTP